MVVKEVTAADVYLLQQENESIPKFISLSPVYKDKFKTGIR